MVSSVAARPNHYETLGVAAGASVDEIADAFARKMRIAALQPMGAATHLCAAYETLRDAARRRAYDRAIGIAVEPDPPGSTWGMAQPRWAPFVASAVPAPTTPERPRQAPEQQRNAAPKTVEAIAASLRELARPVDQPPAAPKRPDHAIEPEVRELLAARPAEPEPLVDEGAGVEWKRPALAVGGLVVAAGLIGTVMGLWVRDADPAAAEPAVTLSVPAAKPQASSEAASAAPAVEQADAPRPAPKASSAGSKRKALAQQVAEVRPAAAEPAASAFVESAAEQAAAQDPLAPAAAAEAAVAADLPLPKATIARTIERIGYSCGSVASASAVEGASGVFKVTCSSGQSYRAAPVHGRYHFRRWGRD